MASSNRARAVPCTARSGTFHSGFHAAIGLAVIHVANPSFSQMSFHQAIVTMLPNHW